MYDPIEAAQSDSDFWESECKEEREKVGLLLQALEEIVATYEATPVKTYQRMEAIARQALATIAPEDV